MPPKKAVSDDEEEEEEDWDALYTDEEDGNGQLDSQTPAEIHKRLLKGSLNQPRHTVISLMTLHGLVHQGLIDLTPDYQREVVWNKAKMIGLIQSLFLNYHIPPILWACSSDNDRGEMVRTCIDGKQRCTSIMRFLDGEIPFVSPSTNEKFFWMMPDRNRGQLLPATLRRKFETMTVPAVEYDDLTDTQQRDIFQRVQLGMTLSSSEKLQAIPGPWPSWISDLRTKFVSKDGTLGEKLDWDKTRGRPFANIAVFVMMAHGSGQSSSQLSSFLERTDAPEEHFKNKVEKALSVLIQIGTDYHQEAFETVSSRLSPIEFQFSCLLIYSRMSVFSARRLAESIGQMRRDIRKTHVDIRANIRLYKALHAILEKLPTKRDRGELPAAEEFSGDVVDPREIRAAKRGRREEAADPSYQGSSIPRGSNANPAMTRQSAGTSASISSSTPRQRVPTGPAAASIPPSNPPRPASSTTSRSTPTGPAYNPSSNGQVPRTSKQPPIPTNQSRQGAPPVSQAPNSAPLGPRSGQEKWTQEQVAHFRAMQQHRINEEQAKRAQGQ